MPRCFALSTATSMIATWMQTHTGPSLHGFMWKSASGARRISLSTL
jgi:hypothetical protein